MKFKKGDLVSFKGNFGVVIERHTCGERGYYLQPFWMVKIGDDLELWPENELAKPTFNIDKPDGWYVIERTDTSSREVSYWRGDYRWSLDIRYGIKIQDYTVALCVAGLFASLHPDRREFLVQPLWKTFEEDGKQEDKKCR